MTFPVRILQRYRTEEYDLEPGQVLELPGPLASELIHTCRAEAAWGTRTYTPPPLPDAPETVWDELAASSPAWQNLVRDELLKIHTAAASGEETEPGPEPSKAATGAPRGGVPSPEVRAGRRRQRRRV